jgi:hypothetical protein
MLERYIEREKGMRERQTDRQSVKKISKWLSTKRDRERVRDRERERGKGRITKTE